MKHFLLLGIAACAPQEEFRAEDLKRHIEALASPELTGRNNETPGGDKAAWYVAAEMIKMGLKPGGTDGYFQPFTTDKARGGSVEAFKGRNVLGILEGTDLKDEYVVINAHHDHLGVVKGTIRPGADDNASGVAMILELARSFAKKPPRRSLLVISFDCEEDGLVGSREFVNSDLFGKYTIVADVCFDLIGGNFYPWETTTIYALGSEYSPEIAASVARHSVEGLLVRQAGVYLIEQMGFSRSDYGNFRSKKVPFVFFSTGTPWYYHSAHDTPDKINGPKIAAAAAYCRKIVADLSGADAKPSFGKRPPPAKSDAHMIRDAIAKVLESTTEIVVSDDQKAKGARHVETLDRLLEKSALEDKDAETIQQGMIWLFIVQAGQIKHKGK